MYSSKEKILKTNVTDLENEVAKTIYDVEAKASATQKAFLNQLYITGAEKIELSDKSSQALHVRIPFRSLHAFKKTRHAVISALEKQFKNTDVIVTANRTIQSKFGKHPPFI